MNVALMEQLAMVQTRSCQEDRMVEFLLAHCKARGWNAWSDSHKNVFVVKGGAELYPCACAHIDTVQPIRKGTLTVEVENEEMRVRNGNGDYVGYGADNKTGVWVCLEMLEVVDVLKVAFFAQEEIGYRGAAQAAERFFEDVAYLVEFDCPSYGIMSYTNAGVRLFDNEGDFIKNAHPVLLAHGYDRWQHHPFTDVVAMRSRFRFPCLNLASGYYNWHSNDEYTNLTEMQAALETGVDLIHRVEARPYHDVDMKRGEPLVEVTGLRL